MQRLEVNGAVRPIYGSLGVKRLTQKSHGQLTFTTLTVKLSDKIHLNICKTNQLDAHFFINDLV